MPLKRLSPELLEKMAKKSGKSNKYLGEQISKRAGRQGISSTAAQLVWAKQLGIGVANQFAKVSADLREEVRSGGTTAPAMSAGINRGKRAPPPSRKEEAITPPTR